MSGSQQRVVNGIEKFEEYRSKLALCARANVFNHKDYDKNVSPFYRELRLALGLKPKMVESTATKGAAVGGS